MLRKWPSYRDHAVPGQPRRGEEIRHFADSARRIAANFRSQGRILGGPARSSREDGPVKPVAYIETSVVSYLTARQSRDVVVAAYQEVTREWWSTASARFELVASELVVTESGAGNVRAARARLEMLDSVTLLDVTENSEELTRLLLDRGAVPREAAADAAHIGIAVANGVDYLVTWNFRHIANAAMRSRIELVCRQAGYEPPVICTPNELMEADHADDTA